MSCIISALQYNSCVFKRWRMLSIFFLLVGVSNLIRVRMVSYTAPALEGYTLSLSLPFLSWSYGLFGAIFVGAAVVYGWLKKTNYAFSLAALYQAALWIIHLVGDRSSYARSLWPRDALLTIVFLTFTALLTGHGGLLKKKADI